MPGLLDGGAKQGDGSKPCQQYAKITIRLNHHQSMECTWSKSLLKEMDLNRQSDSLAVVQGYTIRMTRLLRKIHTIYTNKKRWWNLHNLKNLGDGLIISDLFMSGLPMTCSSVMVYPATSKANRTESSGHSLVARAVSRRRCLSSSRCNIGPKLSAKASSTVTAFS